ncbi:nicotinamide phosphoribosyl transferase [Bacteriophage DSS3_VP1]|uniref:Nicotinamide phosphoribosyltransferase n=1 Tax=Bacteriophage DSS3_VP1 TaxID=2664196 RepID=A0A7S5KQ57_9CAUD|nr:nicotinamide phosphoribosyl transferase [Bacteriophage DSS3_VP1]QGH74674.1 nicotinamide phosphoribosyltransferase [Bacteriophage DSS3_VP1]
MENSNFNLMYQADFYKVSHIAQYPDNVSHIHSTLVARKACYNDNISKEEFMWFGHSLFLEKLEAFEQWFFTLTFEELCDVLKEYKIFLDTRLGADMDVAHWNELWKVRFLPITIHAMPERSIQKFQTPLLTVENIDSRFPWLVGFIETTMLSNIWPVSTAANRAWHIRKVIEDSMKNHTEEEREAIDFMAHDFSYRGMPGDEAAMLTGCGHLANFKGSDTIPAARAMERVYGETTGFSVAATEHSVMCAGGQEDEIETFKRLMKVYPTGILSVVSDTWDYFGTLTDILPKMKSKIMKRDGKLVIRPDSGNPIDIICGKPFIDASKDFYEGDSLEDYLNDTIWETNLNEGDKGLVWDGVDWWSFDVELFYDYECDFVSVKNIQPHERTFEDRGSLELLGETFGYTYDSQGLKLLDPHIGLIYGDGMNQERIKEILERMVALGWSPLNMVFGVGAYTYQFVTRDELSWAFKATAIKRDGEWVAIKKDPKTDPGKASLSGRFFEPDFVNIF